MTIQPVGPNPAQQSSFSASIPVSGAAFDANVPNAAADAARQVGSLGAMRSTIVLNDDGTISFVKMN
jgi:hypothetical protein